MDVIAYEICGGQGEWWFVLSGADGKDVFESKSYKSQERCAAECAAEIQRRIKAGGRVIALSPA